MFDHNIQNLRFLRVISYLRRILVQNGDALNFVRFSGPLCVYHNTRR